MRISVSPVTTPSLACSANSIEAITANVKQEFVAKEKAETANKPQLKAMKRSATA
jgi:hypothetical protein